MISAVRETLVRILAISTHRILQLPSTKFSGCDQFRPAHDSILPLVWNRAQELRYRTDSRRKVRARGYIRVGENGAGRLQSEIQIAERVEAGIVGYGGYIRIELRIYLSRADQIRGSVIFELEVIVADLIVGLRWRDGATIDDTLVQLDILRIVDRQAVVPLTRHIERCLKCRYRDAAKQAAGIARTHSCVDAIDHQGAVHIDQSVVGQVMNTIAQSRSEQTTVQLQIGIAACRLITRICGDAVAISGVAVNPAVTDMRQTGAGHRRVESDVIVRVVAKQAIREQHIVCGGETDAVSTASYPQITQRDVAGAGSDRDAGRRAVNHEVRHIRRIDVRIADVSCQTFVPLVSTDGDIAVVADVDCVVHIDYAGVVPAIRCRFDCDWTCRCSAFPDGERIAITRACMRPHPGAGVDFDRVARLNHGPIEVIHVRPSSVPRFAVDHVAGVE